MRHSLRILPFGGWLGRAHGYASVMHRAEFQELLRHEPFEPFRVRLTSGNAYDIAPNAIALGKNRMFLAFPDSDRWAFCPYLHVASIEALPNGN